MTNTTTNPDLKSQAQGTIDIIKNMDIDRCSIKDLEGAASLATMAAKQCYNAYDEGGQQDDDLKHLAKELGVIGLPFSQRAQKVHEENLRIRYSK